MHLEARNKGGGIIRFKKKTHIGFNLLDKNIEFSFYDVGNH